MLEKLWGFQPWGDNPPLRSYYPIVPQSSSARFAMVREGLRDIGDVGWKPLAKKLDGRSVGV